MSDSTAITQKGQVTIPVKFRKELGWDTGQRVKFVSSSDNSCELIIQPVKDVSAFKGEFRVKKKYSKKLARKSFLKEVLAGKV